MNPAIVAGGYLVMAIAWHEVGHYLAIKLRGLKYKVKNPLSIQFHPTTTKDTTVVLWSGILLGIIPIYTHIAVYGNLLSLLILTGYAIGCQHDIKVIRKCH